jgi:hypothetical protein
MISITSTLIEPPFDPKVENIAAILKGLVSFIPGGGILAEVGDVNLNPLRKRQYRWMVEAAKAIQQIEERLDRNVESLMLDEAFQSFLIEISIIAVKTHQKEKLNALRNALISVADPKRVDEDACFQFIRYIGELSPTHLKILSHWKHSAEHPYRATSLEMMHASFEIFEKLEIDRSAYRTYVQDLSARFLIVISQLDDFHEFDIKFVIESEGRFHKTPIITTIGKQFMSFIRDNELSDRADS